VKMVQIPVFLAILVSMMTTALSSPSGEGLAPADRPISASEGSIPPDPIPPEGVWPGPEPRGDGRSPGGPFRAGGFALERGETYFLQIWLIDTKRIPPTLARDMLRENRSLDEIRDEISKSEGSSTTLGGMILGENHFVLVHINQTSEENCTILDADLVEFKERQRSAEGRTAGHITIRTCEENGVQVGCGNLTLTDGETTSYRLTFPSLQTEALDNGRPAETAGGEPCPW
jgi:hypothetical protein